jgi:Tfp pilus assembly protein PilF
MRSLRFSAVGILLSGCATTPQAIELEDITPVRIERRQQLVEDFEAQRQEAQLAGATQLWEQGEMVACEERLGAILSSDPTYQGAVWLMAELKLSSHHPEQAAELLLRLQQENLDDEAFHISAAVLALRYNQPQVATRLLLNASADLSSSAPLLCALAVAYYRCGDYSAAERVLTRTLSLDSTSALAYFLMACTQSQLGRKSSAETALRQAARLDPRFAAAPQAASLEAGAPALSGPLPHGKRRAEGSSAK